MRAIILSLVLLASAAPAADCVRVSGPWDASVLVWSSRWAMAFGKAPAVAAGAMDAVDGTYVPAEPAFPAPYGRPELARRWKQAGGRNMIWFGDRLNPRDSFDAWYVGDPACAAVPARRASIPRLPTFVPNAAGLGFLDPWGRDAPGFPVVERVVMPQEEAEELGRTWLGLAGEIRLTAIWEAAGEVWLSWSGPSGAVVSVEASEDLVVWQGVGCSTSSASGGSAPAGGLGPRRFFRLVSR